MNIRIGALFLLSAIPVIMQQQIERETSSGEHASIGQVNERRIKRSFKALVKLGAKGAVVWRGMKATYTLLKGAKKIPSVNKGETVYIKPGSYNNAKADFFSVQPTNIQVVSRGLIGHIGDRFVRTVQGRSDEFPYIIIGKLKDIPRIESNKKIIIEYRGL